MKKLLHLIMFTMALLFTVNANAANSILTEGKNVVPMNNGNTATFTMPSTDKITIGITESLVVECAGNNIPYNYMPSSLIGAYVYEFNANEGDVIKFSGNSISTSTVINITVGSIDLKLESVSPKDNAIFNWSSQGMVSVTFNKKILLNTVKLYNPTNGMSYNVDELAIHNNQIGFNITTALAQAFEDGIQPGKAMLIQFEGIREADDPTQMLGGNGKLSLRYGVPQPQTRLESTMVGETALNLGTNEGYNFMSYYPVDVEDGKFVFTFSNDIKEISGARITMGNLDQSTSGRFYYENLEPQIEGNKVTVDARGVMRSLARMFPSVDFETGNEEGRGQIDVNHISFALANVIDVNDNPAYSNQQGSVGTFSYTFTYKEIVDNIIMDGDRPEDREGCVKNSNDRVQLWVDQQLKSIDGVAIYINVDNGQGVDEEGNQVYAQALITMKPEQIETLMSDPIDGTVIGFNMPQLKAMVEESGTEEVVEKEYEAAPGTIIRVVLQVTTTNSMPHDLVVNYYYKQDPTGITEIKNTLSSNGKTYNLAGQQVSNAAKGIVIMDGKKIIR